MSEATTEGICVVVHSRFVPERSHPSFHRYLYVYHVSIENQSRQPVQLQSRHWVIIDGHGETEEVRGPGVVGQQPWLNPGDRFRYTSMCQLDTPIGSMRGTYQMVREDGTEFDAEIQPFTLYAPQSLN